VALTADMSTLAQSIVGQVSSVNVVENKEEEWEDQIRSQLLDQTMTYNEENGLNLENMTESGSLMPLPFNSEAPGREEGVVPLLPMSRTRVPSARGTSRGFIF
jgi:hypothetical protein